jgi:hypothetical protein
MNECTRNSTVEGRSLLSGGIGASVYLTMHVSQTLQYRFGGNKIKPLVSGEPARQDAVELIQWLGKICKSLPESECDVMHGVAGALQAIWWYLHEELEYTRALGMYLFWR